MHVCTRQRLTHKVKLGLMAVHMSVNALMPIEDSTSVLRGKHWIQLMTFCFLSYDVASGSEITPCNKTDKPLVVYRFTGNVMTSKTRLRT